MPARPPHAVPLLLLLAASATATALELELVSNEGQRLEQDQDRVFLVTNDRAPAPPLDAPPLDTAGRAWTDAHYQASGWLPSIPVWRAPDWPRTGLPAGADWLWASPASPELLAALLFPDADNATTFPRRRGRTSDGAEHHGFGYIPAVIDSAAYLRRELCLPLNVAVANATLDLLADAQARVRLDGALVLDTCEATPESCAAAGVPGYAATASTTTTLEGGAHVLGVQAWSWQPESVLAGVLYRLGIDYDVAPLNLVVAELSLVEGALSVKVGAGANAIPAGASLVAASTTARRVSVLPALPANGSLDLRIPLDFAGPGALVTVTADALDCLDRPAKGDRNLLGGAPAGVGALAAIGVLEELDEDDNQGRLRVPPLIDPSLDQSAVAMSSFRVRGRSEAGSLVRIVRGAATLAETTADADGRFEGDVTLVPGANVLAAIADGEGVASEPSPTVEIFFDPTAPPAPVIDAPASDARLLVPRVDVRGRGLAGATIIVALDEAPICEGPVDAAGGWSCADVAVDDGPHRVTARQRSRAGLVSEPGEVAFTVDTALPDAGDVDAGTDAGPPDSGDVDAGTDAGSDAGTGEPDAGPRRYGVAGGGGCAQSAPSLAALVGLLLVLVRRRRALAVALLVSTAGLANAQTATPHEQALFAGPTPLTGAASPRHGGLAVSLSFDYARDPLVLIDLENGARVGALVADRLDARAQLAFPLSDRLELALALPAAALHRADGLIPGLPVPGRGLGDVSLGLLVGLAEGPRASLGLVFGVTLPTAADLAGAGHATIRGALVTNVLAGRRVAFAFEAGARSATSAATSARLDTGPSVPTLELRAGVAALAFDARLAPFLELAASGPIAADLFDPARAPLLVAAGLRFALPAGFEVTASVARGLTDAPGSPAGRALVSMGFHPGAPARPAPFAPPPPPPAPKPLPLLAPLVFAPLEGEATASVRPSIEGEAEAGAAVTLLLDGRPLTSVRAGADGMFRYEPVEDLAPGMHEIVASQATDRGVSDPSLPHGFLVEPLVAAPDDSARRRRIEEILRVVREQTGLTARETPEGVAVSTNALFDFDRAIIREEEEWKLDDLAKVIRAFPSVQIRIDSHTDNIGSARYNLALSDRRAASVLTYLVDYRGISAMQVDGVGQGSERPVASNATPEGRKRNRRFAECMFLVP